MFSASMCDYCSSVLGKLAKSHDVNVCKYRKSLYCGICNEYGHSNKLCAMHLQQKMLQNNSREKEVIPIDSPSKPILWVVNHPQSIRAVLAAYDKQPAGKEKNPKIVEEIGKETGRRVVFVKYQCTT